MPKTKISEYSTTNADNTDIESINIAEGCAPSGINNAIRELMVHLKEFQTGASGDGFTFAGGTLMTGTNTLSGTNVLSGSTTAAFAAGTVSAPSIYASGDTNTGIFFPAADTIAFAEGGAEAMRIDSSGRLIIASSAAETTISGSAPVFQVTGSGFNSIGSFTRRENNANGPAFCFAKSRNTSANSYTVVQNGDSLGAIIFIGDDGTDLDTYGAVISAQVDGTPGANDMPGRLTFSTTADGASSPTERMRIDSSGNVGIGTSSPSVRFHVEQTSPGDGRLIRVVSSGVGAGFVGVKSTGNTFIDANTSATALEFRTQDTERARITSGGLLAINATATASGNTNAKLFVKGASGYDVCEVQVATNGTYAFDFRNASGTNVGNITVNSGGTAFTTTSDYRLKENIAPMQNALSVVNQLKPCTYTWKSDGSAGQGFIAHELQSVIPDCVTGEKDATQIQQYEVSPAVYEEVVIPAVLDEEGNEVEPERTEKRLVFEAVMGEREVPRYQGVDTSYLVATLTAAIQELKAELDATKAEVAAMKAQ